MPSEPINLVVEYKPDHLNSVGPLYLNIPRIWLDKKELTNIKGDLDQGIVNLVNERYEEAGKNFEKALMAPSYMDTIKYGRMLVEIQKGNLDEAQKHYNAVTVNDPGLIYNKCVFDILRENYGVSIEGLSKLTGELDFKWFKSRKIKKSYDKDLENRTQLACYHAGIAYSLSDDSENAIAHYKKSIKLGNKDPNAVLGLVDEYIKSQNSEEARKVLKKLVFNDKTQPETKLRAADLFYRLENYDGALKLSGEVYRSEFATSGRGSELLYDSMILKGLSNWKKGFFMEGITEIKYAIESDPDNPKGYFIRSEMYNSLEDSELEVLFNIFKAEQKMLNIKNPNPELIELQKEANKRFDYIKMNWNKENSPQKDFAKYLCDFIESVKA